MQEMVKSMVMMGGRAWLTNVASVLVPDVRLDNRSSQPVSFQPTCTTSCRLPRAPHGWRNTLNSIAHIGMKRPRSSTHAARRCLGRMATAWVSETASAT